MEDENLATCPDCGGTLQSQIGQHVGMSSDGIDWWRSTWCSQCDYTTEEEGRGLPPENYRQVLLHMDGVWALVINDYSERVMALRVVRQTMQLSMERAHKVQESRASEVFRGTKTEVQWLVDLLRTEGVLSARAVVAQ